MTLKEALSLARETLTKAGIENASLESELLLRYALDIDRTQLYLDLESELSPEKHGEFQSLVERRLSGEPAAYIMNSREFYGLEFYVDSRVLIPRPETELLVEKAVELVREKSFSCVADVGTGSGAIAVSLAVNLPGIKIYALDISLSALEVALGNCQKHGVEERVALLEGDMLEPLPEKVDLIIANLPYVRETELPQVNTLGFEPVTALSGGAGGLDRIKLLCNQVSGKLRPGGFVLLEIGQGQGEAVKTYLSGLYPQAEISIASDLAGVERMVTLSLPS